MTAADNTTSDAPEGGLRPGLKPRHMTMIALGGIIGAGLFVGSSGHRRLDGLLEDEATRSYLIPSLISLGIVLAAAYLRGRREREPAARRGPAQAARPGAA